MIIEQWSLLEKLNYESDVIILSINTDLIVFVKIFTFSKMSIKDLLLPRILFPKMIPTVSILPLNMCNNEIKLKIQNKRR